MQVAPATLTITGLLVRTLVGMMHWRLTELIRA